MKAPIAIALTAMLCTCRQPAFDHQAQTRNPAPPDSINPYGTVAAIPPPPGYHRLATYPHSFAMWLRDLPLKKDRTVYLYNGRPKANQNAQFAVLDISVGHTDLQQCADAVMRLRAEYLYSMHEFTDINFYTEEGNRLNFQEWANGGRVRLTGNHLVSYTLQSAGHYCEDRSCFDGYLTTLFTWCGTHTLERQLSAKPIEKIDPGDVLIKGGAPGHAMIVVDVVEDTRGHRMYLLAQSYMPAQDIHVVKNPDSPCLSPWFEADSSQGLIETPEWTFTINQLRTWPRHIPRL
ncbi:DUF4846 domain-containing protein [Puia sp.]|jgi:hypothetical protein|uniref:DUF4846 domain-containing protein n=1 Tax=Puia sp. TaxID=2045100 RepID=UPI002F40DA31